MEQLSILWDSFESTLRYTLIQTLRITKTTKTLCVSIKGCAPAGRRGWWRMRCFASHRHYSFTRRSSFVGSWCWHKGKPRSFLALKATIEVIIRIHFLKTSGTYSTILHGGGHGNTEICHWLLFTSFVVAVMQGLYLFLYNKSVFVCSLIQTLGLSGAPILCFRLKNYYLFSITFFLHQSAVILLGMFWVTHWRSQE